MADVEDDLSQCTVCFESYGVAGDHVPRLLPCTHTLCGTCIRNMIRKEVLECPECRAKHAAKNRHKSFPQNKYITANIKKQVVSILRPPTAEEPVEKMFPKCEEHGKEQSFYCATKGCEKAVFSLCMLKYHKYDDVVDIGEDHKEKTEFLAENVPMMIENLQAKKAQILSVGEELEKNIKECITKIKVRKEDINLRFDEMLREANDLLKDGKAYLNDNVGIIDDIIAPLNKMKEKLTKMSYEKLLSRVKTYKEIEKKVDVRLSSERVYLGYEYDAESVTKQDIDKVCGQLNKVEKRVEFTEMKRTKDSVHPIIIDPREKTSDGTVYSREYCRS